MLLKTTKLFVLTVLINWAINSLSTLTILLMLATLRATAVPKAVTY